VPFKSASDTRDSGLVYVEADAVGNQVGEKTPAGIVPCERLPGNAGGIQI